MRNSWINLNLMLDVGVRQTVFSPYPNAVGEERVVFDTNQAERTTNVLEIIRDNRSGMCQSTGLNKRTLLDTAALCISFRDLRLFSKQKNKSCTNTVSSGIDAVALFDRIRLLLSRSINDFVQDGHDSLFCDAGEPH